MNLKNLSARLITINVAKGKAFSVAPMETVAIDCDLGVAQSFVDNMIAAGDLIEVAGPKVAKHEPQTAKRGRPAKTEEVQAETEEKAD